MKLNVLLSCLYYMRVPLLLVIILSESFVMVDYFFLRDCCKHSALHKVLMYNMSLFVSYWSYLTYRLKGCAENLYDVFFVWHTIIISEFLKKDDP